VSLSIGSMPGELFSDSAVANVAGSTGAPSSLPFDVILDDQTGSSGEETGGVGGADLPVDLRDTEILAVLAAAATEAADDALTRVLTVLGKDAQTSQAAKSDHKDATVIGVIDKDKPANEAAALSLLATQDVVKQLELFLAPPASTPAEPAGRDTPAGSAVDDQVTRNLAVALADMQTVPAEDSVSGAPPASTTVDAASPITDPLIGGVADGEQPNQLPLANLTLPRPTMPGPPETVVDAIRLTIARDTFPDLDRGSNQPSTDAGFDRRSAKTGTVPAMRVTGAFGGNMDSSVAPSAPVSASSVGASPEEAGVVSSIVQTLRLQMRDGVGTAVVHLEPEYLGAVSISLRVENGVVMATMHAENPQVRGWMEANAPLLRESLASQGLTLDRLIVTDDRIADDPSSNRQGHEQDQPARQRPRRDDDAATFEVVV
jgi:flagellar hook-length control protein FliK